ncbi:hypothetical protein HBI42_036220 [Parastagonospora nodorum]|nr:hypothetical protein HBI12_037910 [Parastagonospora nodorum]KAH6230409.1 hypothetical protein HBI43_044300 [Parastagonospora nodorum]KAH6269874.1 hypothetical protein HBI42_036220 [Parastagonospora nodorum]
MSSLDPLLIFFSETPDSLGYSTASLHYITFQDASMRAATPHEMYMSPFATSPSPGCYAYAAMDFQHALNNPHSPDPTLPQSCHTFPIPLFYASLLLPSCRRLPLPRLPLRCHAQPPCSQHRKEGGRLF